MIAVKPIVTLLLFLIAVALSITVAPDVRFPVPAMLLVLGMINTLALMAWREGPFAVRFTNSCFWGFFSVFAAFSLGSLSCLVEIAIRS